MKHNPCTIAILALTALSSCTYTITQVQTKGVATDVVDDTNTPTADVDASLSVPTSVIP